LSLGGISPYTSTNNTNKKNMQKRTIHKNCTNNTKHKHKLAFQLIALQ
jgi:hypothetical protein